MLIKMERLSSALLSWFKFACQVDIGDNVTILKKRGIYTNKKQVDFLIFNYVLFI